MDMPDKISIRPQGGFDPVTGKPRTGYRFCIGVHATQYTRTDLAQSLADALEGIMRDLPSNKDWLDPMLERMAKDALANYRKGE